MALACCNSVPIKRCRNLSQLHFEQNYLATGCPVIIEDATANLPAMNWTLDSLCKCVGRNEVLVRTNTNCKNYRLGTDYKIRKTTFKNYIDDMLAQNSRGRSSYLAVQNIKKALPQLEADIRLPEYVGKLHAGPFLWIAYKGHYEYCHQDPDDGLLIIVNGQKDVRLFAQDMAHLYPNPKGSKGRTTQSQIDCLDPNLERFPEFVHAVCMYGTLNSGDMLYIPAFCWHQVTTMQTTISINIFWGNGGTDEYISKLMTPQFWPAFSHWLLNVIEQNRSCESFQRMLARLPEALYNFIMTQWHEEASPKQIEMLVNYIKDYLYIEELPDAKLYKSGKHPPKLQIRGLLWRNK